MLDIQFTNVFQVKKILCDWLARLLFMKRPTSARLMLARSCPHSDVDGVFATKSTADVHRQDGSTVDATNGEVGIAMKAMSRPRDTVVVVSPESTSSRGASLAVDLVTPNSHSRTRIPGCQDRHRHRGKRGLSAGGETWSSACQLLASPAISCRVTARGPRRHDPAVRSSSSKVDDDAGGHTVGDTDRPSSTVVDALSAVLYELQLLTGKLRDDETRLAICSDWKFAAMVVDRFCLILFSVFTVVSTFAILFSAPQIAL